MNNKAAIELSVNFIVTFIIAVAIFSLSIYFAASFFRGAEEIRASIDEQTEAKIQDSLSQSGTLVAFPLNKKEGSVKDRLIYGIGVLNIQDEAKYFYVSIVPHKRFDMQSNEFSLPSEASAWLNYNPGPYATDSHESSIMPVLAEIQNEISPGNPTLSGTYVFNVCIFESNPADLGVTCSSSQLTSGHFYTDQIYKLYVTVK